MKRILVIDDEPDVCTVLTRVLERAGYQTLIAPDSEQGLAACREHVPDVVITDIIMPGMHGVDLIKVLRAEFPQIGIVAITGGGNVAVAGYQPGAIKTAAYIAAAEQAGADFWLTKPFEREELVKVVAAASEKRQQRVN